VKTDRVVLPSPPFCQYLHLVDADEFHIKVENGTISELQIEPVELKPVASLKEPQVNGATIQSGTIIGGIIALLIVVTSLVAIRRQWNKS
jgi:hypothetical protein